MDKLSRNHPRFCARYRRFVGEVESPGKYFPPQVSVHGERFSLTQGRVEYEPGEAVYVARRVPVLRGQPSRWQIHLIELPEAYWYYESWYRSQEQGRRVGPYKAYAQTWFGSAIRLLQKR